MQRVKYAEGLEVDFTDGEFDRLAEIKSDRNWVPNKLPTPSQNNRVAVMISPLLREKAKAYAKLNGVTLWHLMNNLIETLSD